MPMDGCSISDASSPTLSIAFAAMAKVVQPWRSLPGGAGERVDVVNRLVISAADKETIVA